MKDIILTVLTSEGCGHCHNLRGNGELGNGTQFTQYDYLKSHLDPLHEGKGCIILNIHFGSMAGKVNEIRDISKIYLRKKVIFQEKYYSQDNKVMVKVTTLDSDNKSKSVTDKNANVDHNWSAFVGKKIPTDIERYTFFFPCFVVFELNDWRKGKNILGLTNAGLTIRNENGEYMLEKNGKSLSERNVLPQKLVTEAMTGLTKFEPHKDLLKKEEPVNIEQPSNDKKEEPTEPKEPVEPKEPAEPKEPKEPKEKVGGKKLPKGCSFLIKNYDDDEDD